MRKKDGIWKGEGRNWFRKDGGCVMRVGRRGRMMYLDLVLPCVQWILPAMNKVKYIYLS